MDDGSNAAFVSNPGKDNQFNKGADAQVKKNIFYDADTRQLTTFYNGIHYHISLPIDPHHEGPKVGTFLQWLPFGTSVTSPNHEPDSLVMVILFSLPVDFSSALTLSMPLASMSKVTSICGTPRGIGGMPERLNSPSLLLSLVRERSPSKTW